MSSQPSERNIPVIGFLGFLSIAVVFFYYRRYLQYRATPVEVTAPVEVIASPHMDVDEENHNSIDLEMMCAEAVSFKFGLDDSDEIPKPTEAFQSAPIIAENIQIFK
jgi:hypothetical protein